MDEETLKLITDLHVSNRRQGPGSHETFLRALKLSKIDTTAPVSIADIGCGTGSATIPLLQQTNAKVTAVDFLPAFLEELDKNAREVSVIDRVTILEADMSHLPFTKEQFDVIWSEGAIYNIGFEKGVKEWREFLKPNGVLAVSEITWLQPDVPQPLEEYWVNAYPEIATAEEKIVILEESGYSTIEYFPFPTDCWLQNYYEPLQASFNGFLERNDYSDAAKEIVVAEEKEIAMYKQYKDYYSYGFYIATRG